MRTLIVNVDERHSADKTIRAISFEGIEFAPPDIFFESIGIDVPRLETFDFAVVASLFFAMGANVNLHIKGPVTGTLLRNLEEFQEAWAAWVPSYRPTMITADTELDDARVATRKGVFAFSGGVDSVFALLRHHQGHSGRRTCRPIAAVMVQGFDIPLAAKDTFAVAERAARGILEQLSVPLAIVRTNWKEALSRNWHAEFGAGLVSCLHQFTGLANFGVLGADEDYADLEFPWGSNPVTNHLLSGGKFGIHTEGAGFTRTARVHFIAQFPNAARRLRVCWEGPVTGQNCGICEKCIRTKLNFMASGHDPTVCFDGAPTNADIAGIKTSTPIQIAFLREILRYARREGVTDQWVAVLQRTVIKNSIRQFAGRALRKLRTSATLADRPS